MVSVIRVLSDARVAHYKVTKGRMYKAFTRFCQSVFFLLGAGRNAILAASAIVIVASEVRAR
jgi:hypothetical protein